MLSVSLPGASLAADLVQGGYVVIHAPDRQPDYPVYRGRAVAIDGRTVRFPDSGAVAQLMDLDTCELPQWAYHQDMKRPVPCGGFAKAWLKRLIGQNNIACYVATYAPDGMPLAYCFRGKLDIGLQMIAKGLARVATPDAQCSAYLQFQTKAQLAKYGIWKDRVLDMSIWRERAKDRTLARNPIADYELIIGSGS
jgi:endonuclease YncB( thermonuclease family)